MPNLETLSKVIENQEPEQTRNDRNDEIGDREDIFKGESQALPPAIRVSKFPINRLE